MSKRTRFQHALTGLLWSGLVSAGLAGLIWSGYPTLAIIQIAVFRQPQGF